MARKHKNTKKKRAQQNARPKRKGPKRLPDPSDHPDATTRFVSAHEATKTYLCPGCNRDIPPGLSHMVAVPPDDPDLRRHWHRGCWDRRESSRR